MCGIAGILNKQAPASQEQIKRMTDTMSHRGPDAEGFYIDGPLAFGHRRLSIIDLSQEANQPFRQIILAATPLYSMVRFIGCAKSSPNLATIISVRMEIPK